MHSVNFSKRLIIILICTSLIKLFAYLIKLFNGTVLFFCFNNNIAILTKVDNLKSTLQLLIKFNYVYVY